MKAIFKLFILNFLALALLPSCSEDDQSNSEQNDPISGNISPVVFTPYPICQLENL